MPPLDSPNPGSLPNSSHDRSIGADGSSMRSHEHEAHDVNPQLTSTSTGKPSEQFGADDPGRRPEFAGDMRASDVREAAQQGYEQARQFTNEALEKARRQLRESRGEVTQRAREILDQQKLQFCQGLDHAAQAMHAAARSLEEGDRAGVARYAHMAGDSLGRVHEYLCAAGVDDVAQDVRQFVRRHPEWVTGGLFIAGLALARLLKADRAIGPRGRPPLGADEGLWRDVYRSQFDDGQQSGSRSHAWGDFEDTGISFSDGARQNTPGVAGYNPSGDYGNGMDSRPEDAGFGASYGTAAAGRPEASSSFPGGAAGIGDAELSSVGDDSSHGGPERDAGTDGRRQDQPKGDWQ